MPMCYISAQHRVAGRCLSHHNVCSKKAIEREAWSTLHYYFSCLSFKKQFCVFSLLTMLRFSSAGCQHHWSLTVPEWHLPLACAGGEMVTLSAISRTSSDTGQTPSDPSVQSCCQRNWKGGGYSSLTLLCASAPSTSIAVGRAGLPCEVRM